MSQGRRRDKVALVTGAGSGIGRAAATLLGSEGAVILVADIDPKTARAVAAAITADGGRGEPLPLDVSDEAAWQQAVERALASHGRLDVVVNNAGVAFARSVADTSLEEWRRVMAVNLDGVFLGTKHGIRAMQAGKGGSIVNVASVYGIKPFAGASAYSASKAAVRQFTRIAAIECQDAGNAVRVNAVSPGGVKTPVADDGLLPRSGRTARRGRGGVPGAGRLGPFAAVLLGRRGCPHNPLPGVGRIRPPDGGRSRHGPRSYRVEKPGMGRHARGSTASWLPHDQ